MSKNSIPARVIRSAKVTLKKASKNSDTLLGDLWDHQKVVTLMERGQAVKAAEFILDMDTEPRDSYSNLVFRWAQDLIYEVEYL